MLSEVTLMSTYEIEDTLNFHDVQETSSVLTPTSWIHDAGNPNQNELKEENGCLVKFLRTSSPSDA